MDIRQISEGLADAVARAGQSVVEVRAGRRPASGVAWTDELVLTTHHTVRRDDGIVVLGPSGEEQSAVLVGRDGSTDLALLKVSGGGLAPATFEPTASLRVGSLVLPIGRVGGRARATLGIVSDMAGPWQTSRGGQVDHWVEVDAALPPGFGGGPLSDPEGRVRGLNTPGLTHRGAVLPVATVVRVAERLRDHGTLAPGYLGVGFYPGTLPDDVAAVAGQVEALMSVSIEPGGPGEKAGVQVGDALVRLDDQPVHGLRQLVGLLTAAGADREVRLTVVRAGALHTLSVTLAARPGRRAWCG